LSANLNKLYKFALKCIRRCKLYF